MPGVPAEMKYVMEHSVLPFLKQHTDGHHIRHRTIRTIGIGESSLASSLEPISQLEQYGRIAFLPSYMDVKVRISAEGNDLEKVDSCIKQAEKIIHDKAGQFIYGYDEETLEQIIGNILRKNSATIAIAESCTGGQIADLITIFLGVLNISCRGTLPIATKQKTIY